MNEKKAEIRIQFRDVPGDMFKSESGDASSKTNLARDELVVRVQPNEAIYLKVNTKRPGEMGFTIEETELDLTYNERYRGVKLPDAYERLILDVFMGSKINFVRSDELEEAWRIVDPVLAEIDKKNIPVIQYKFGVFGIPEAFEATSRHGYVFRGTYVWKDQKSTTKPNPSEKKEETEAQATKSKK